MVCGQFGPQGRKLIELYDRVVGEALIESIRYSLRFVSCIGYGKHYGIILIWSTRTFLCQRCPLSSSVCIAKQAFSQSSHGLVGRRDFILPCPLGGTCSLP